MIVLCPSETQSFLEVTLQTQLRCHQESLLVTVPLGIEMELLFPQVIGSMEHLVQVYMKQEFLGFQWCFQNDCTESYFIELRNQSPCQ